MELNQQPVRLIIEIDGGIVQQVVASSPVEFLVYDRDVEGNEAETTASRPSLDGSGYVTVFRSAPETANNNRELVGLVFDVVAKENGVQSSLNTGPGSAEAQNTCVSQNRCIFSEALTANFVRIGEEAKLHDLAISRAVIGQVILEQIGGQTLISETLLTSKPEIWESFIWVMSSFNLEAWRGKTIGEFLSLWGFQDGSDPRHALALPQDAANRHGVHLRYITVREMRSAKPVQSHGWLFQDGTEISLLDRSPATNNLAQMN